MWQMPNFARMFSNFVDFRVVSPWKIVAKSPASIEWRFLTSNTGCLFHPSLQPPVFYVKHFHVFVLKSMIRCFEVSINCWVIHSRRAGPSVLIYELGQRLFCFLNIKLLALWILALNGINDITLLMPSKDLRLTTRQSRKFQEVSHVTIQPRHGSRTCRQKISLPEDVSQLRYDVVATKKIR